MQKYLKLSLNRLYNISEGINWKLAERGTLLERKTYTMIEIKEGLLEDETIKKINTAVHLILQQDTSSEVIFNMFKEVKSKAKYEYILELILQRLPDYLVNSYRQDFETELGIAHLKGIIN